ncbi:MAG: type II toxin-antitoxin system Phd/YefM family antitoxin [bacterium]|nr:type II toxin-antitoxin system Phd/YefM family antitoxin [bacterium]
MNLMEDIRSIDDLEFDTREVLATVHRTGRPLIVTVDGRPDVVILPAEKLPTKMTAMRAAVELATVET